MGALSLIKSQTNYTEEEAKTKLEEHDGNYMNVIKEYLNPNFRNKKKKPEKKTVNEKMMYEIRNFMDTANSQYLKRKEMEEQKKRYLKDVYDKFLKEKEKYPDCVYNPPKVMTCDPDCNNPLCPGKLLDDNTYSKMKKQNEKINDDKSKE
jgi:hypothetical protein